MFHNLDQSEPPPQGKKAVKQQTRDSHTTWDFLKPEGNSISKVGFFFFFFVSVFFFFI